VIKTTASPVVVRTETSKVKVVEGAAQSFKAPIQRPSVGRGFVKPSVSSDDAPPGQDAIEHLDKVHWLRMKCLMTLYYVKKEASVSGISVSEFAAKFFNVNKTFLPKECQAIGEEDILRFLEKSFSSPPSSPTGSSDSLSSADALANNNPNDLVNGSDPTAAATTASAEASSNKTLVKIVANTTIMFNRTRFCELIQRMITITVNASIKRESEDEVQLPSILMPVKLVNKILGSVACSPSLEKLYGNKSAIAGLFVNWFFGRFLPPPTTGGRVTVPRDIRTFSAEILSFAKGHSAHVYDYSVFPVPSDVEQYIRGMDPDEISDPIHIRNNNPAALKWIPVRICASLTPSLMYFTRINEQETMNLLSDEMQSFYESSEGKDADYHVPIELLTMGSLIAVPLRSRITSRTRRVINSEDQNGPNDALERSWTRAIITSPYNHTDKTFVAHLIDMGCGMKFREGRFLPRSRFLAKEHGFDKGFAVQAGLFSIVPPVTSYLDNFLANSDSLISSGANIAEVPDLLSRKGFPVDAIDFIRSSFSVRRFLTACFFESKRKGLRYEALVVDVSTNEDEYLTTSLVNMNAAEQLQYEDAILLSDGKVTQEDLLKQKLMVKLREGLQ
jgi:hypothetical protein